MGAGLTRGTDIESFERSYFDRLTAEFEAATQTAQAVVPARLAPDSGLPALAGWWCDPHADPRLIVLPNPWDNRTAIAPHAEYSLGLARALAERVGPALDRLHSGRPRSVRYWDLMLTPWLLHLVCAAIDRRLFCRAVAKLRPDLEIVGARMLRPSPTMADLFNDLLWTDRGNAALIGELAREAGIRVAIDEVSEHHPVTMARIPRPAPRRLVAEARRAARAGIWRIAAAKRGRRVAVVTQTQLTARDAAELIVRTGWARVAPAPPVFAQPPRLGQVPVNDRARNDLAGELAELEFGGIVAKALPRSLVEDRAHLEQASVRLYGHPCAAVVTNYATKELENDFIGRCAEAGAPLAFAQHGGAYLQSRVHLQGELERRADGTFLSWGGQGEGVRPLPNPRLERMRDRHVGGRRVVIVDYMHPPVVYATRFGSVPMGNQGHRHTRMLTEFVEALGPTRRELFLKRFPAPLEGPERPAVLDELPFRDARPWRATAPALVARARLALVAYPDTPLIEAMVLGVPTVGLWDPELWELRDDAVAPFAMLSDAGIVYADPHAAAAHVDRVYARASEWWASAEVQAARAAFLDRFARQGDWLGEWTTLLRQLAGPHGG